MKKQELSWADAREILQNHPSFLELHSWLQYLAVNSDEWPTSESINTAIRSHDLSFPWQYIVQQKVPSRARNRGQASLNGYISQICFERKIPLREQNLHDYLNALIFVMFPKSKMALTRRHYQESPEGVKPGQNRTRTQDLLTIFDEGGVIRVTDLQGHTKDLIFGHAIYEHIMYAKPVRAAVLDVKSSTPIHSATLRELVELTDELFAKWLADFERCKKADEFSFLEFSP